MRVGQSVDLRWPAGSPSYRVEILALEADEVLLARDVAAPPLRVEIPWLGTYRWRVSTRDARGLESPPSAEGLICAVEKVAGLEQRAASTEISSRRSGRAAPGSAAATGG